jgi:hypothetical protein
MLERESNAASAIMPRTHPISCRPVKLILFLTLLADWTSACAATRAQTPQRRDAYPCSSLTASRDLDSARITFAEIPGTLVIGSFSVTGDPATRGAVFLLPRGPLPGGRTLQQSFDSTGVITFDNIPPGRYDIKVEPFPYERITQELDILPGRADTLCFVVRTRRVPEGFGRRP